MLPWIGVDFDGTLVHYDPLEIEPYGQPISEMVATVLALIAKGWLVKIVTARVSIPEDVEEQTRVVKEACLKYLGVELEVTCSKDYGMVLLLDDRARGVIPNTGVIIGGLPSGL